jgi:hypothetical protein
MAKAISKIDETIAKLREHGQLFDKKGGRWTYPGRHVDRVVDRHSATWRYTIPVWFVLTGTRTAFVTRGEAVVTEKSYGRPAAVKPANQVAAAERA